MLKKIWCVPVATWFIPIATLVYRCSNLSSFTFFCIESNAIFHFYCSLFINFRCAGSFICLIHRLFCCHILPVAQQFRKHCHLQVHFATAAYTELCKIMISYRLKYNKYRYFSSTGIPRILSYTCCLCGCSQFWPQKRWGNLMSFDRLRLSCFILEAAFCLSEMHARF